jgi:hypothetical protein
MTTDHAYDKIDLLSYFTGDASDEKRKAIEAHVALCASCSRHLAVLESEKSAFLKAHPFETTMALPPRRTGRRVLPFVRRRYYALAASLMLFVCAGYLFMSSRTGPDYRIKGGTVGLKAFVLNHSGAIEKRGERVYYTGEKIQFLYSCAEENRLILMGLDTTGAITTYFPSSQDSSTTLERGADLPLPNSIVLDEYTGRELFLAIFSKKTLSVPDMRQRLSARFAGTHSIDSIDINENGAVTVRYFCTILGGGRR